MLDQRNAVETVVRRYYAEVVNAWPVSSARVILAELLSEAVVFHTPNDAAGQAGLGRHEAFLSWHHSAFPDQEFKVDDIVLSDDKAACRWTLVATHRGAFLGVEATGRHVEVSGMDFFHMDGERIAEF